MTIYTSVARQEAACSATTGASLGTFASDGGLTRPLYLTFGPMPVPEPSTIALLAAGLLPLVRVVRRRRIADNDQ